MLSWKQMFQRLRNGEFLGRKVFVAGDGDLSVAIAQRLARQGRRVIINEHDQTRSQRWPGIQVRSCDPSQAEDIASMDPARLAAIIIAYQDDFDKAMLVCYHVVESGAAQVVAVAGTREQVNVLNQMGVKAVRASVDTVSEVLSSIGLAK